MLNCKHIHIFYLFVVFVLPKGMIAQSDALPNTTQSICFGDSVQLAPTNGVAYQWVENSWLTFSQLQSPNPVVTPTESTIFEVEITFQNNETEVNWFEINVEEPPSIAILASQESGCVPKPISFSAEGLDNTYAYLWELEGGVFEYAAPAFIHTYNNPGDFIPTLQVVSQNGCIYNEEFSTSIQIEQAPEASFSVNREVLSTLNGTLACQNEVQNAASYFWSTSTGLSSEEMNPEFFFESDQAFEIEVCLEVLSNLGCSQSECKNVSFKPTLLLHMPQVFTPNNDGLNDTFGPVATGLKNTGFHFIIWNRWGAVVFETNDPNERWNAKMLNTGKLCQDGRYHWQLKAQAASLGEDQDLSGSIFLIR